MLRFVALALLVVASAAVLVSAEDLSFDRVKLVQHYPNSRSWFFRTNEPTIQSNGKTVFAYNQLLQYFGQRSASEANATLPTTNVYLVDLALNTIFEHGVKEEEEFFAANPKLGKFLNWVLVGDVISPQMVSPQEQQQLIENGTIWQLDKTPARVLNIEAMLRAGPPAGYDALVVFTHCSAGEDRTGEMVLSYQMAFGDIYKRFYPAFSPLYAMDCSANKTGAGRCPSFFSTAAASWYCLTMNLFNLSSSQQRTDCTSAYRCKLWSSHCEPTQ